MTLKVIREKLTILFGEKVANKTCRQCRLHPMETRQFPQNTQTVIYLSLGRVVSCEEPDGPSERNCVRIPCI